MKPRPDGHPWTAAVRTLQRTLEELQLLRGKLDRNSERSPSMVRARVAGHVQGIIELITDELRLQDALPAETFATARPPGKP
jgi:hypothetical protein